jgi:acetylglutamate kinase
MAQSTPTRGVIATLGYVKKFAGTTVLIKLGGAALQDEKLVENLCDDLSLIRSVGVNIVLVHGGGPSINQELTLRGISWEFVDGLRVTTPQMMDVIEMTLCGFVNRRIVRTLNQSGVPAVGISGTDASTLFCKKQSAKLGQVGEISQVNTSYINAILNTQEKGIGTIPVIAPVGVGKKGEAYNINADWAAVRIAEALGIKKVLFLTDQEGILDSTQKLIQELDAGELENLIETSVVQGGMLAKARTVLHALRNGVTDVHIFNARRPNGLIEELFTDLGVGTVCRLRARRTSTSYKEPLHA